MTRQQNEKDVTMSDGHREAERLRMGLRTIIRNGWDDYEDNARFDARDMLADLSDLLGPDYPNDDASWLAPTLCFEPDGRVCGECMTPVESEPCAEHQVYSPDSTRPPR